VSNGWNEYSFAFFASGSDTLTITAETNPSEWYVDNVSVVGAVAAPDQVSTVLLLGLGMVALAAARYSIPSRLRLR